LNCADFLDTANGVGKENFLVISGDCVCDFDLTALMDYHLEKQADVTLALYSHKEPCEYGLVVTNDDGRIERFIEKPAWDHVLTDRINTGIYVISPSILTEIPKGEPYDFGRDLFPKLLREGRKLYGFQAEGYWCDIGSTNAYHQCCLDALQGKIKTNMHAPNVKNDVWCASSMPEGAVIIPPVYIGKNAVIDKGASIGPLAVIGASSIIASGAAVSHSVINGAVINENASAEGAVVCSGVSVGRSSTLGEGSVIGAGCIIGDGCVISAGAKIWPERQIPPGSVITGNLSHGMLNGGLSFTKPGIISGELGITITAEACLRLGEVTGEFGRVGVGWCGGEASRIMAEAFGCGVCATGGELIRYDAGFVSCASYAGYLFDLPLTVFIEESRNAVTLAFFGKNGGKITRDLERKLETSISEPHQTSSGRTGRAAAVTGVCEAYVSAAARQAYAMMENTGDFSVAVTGGGAENRALKSALMLMNCTVSEKKAGLPSFEVLYGGTALSATDEEGYRLSDEQLNVITAFVECSCGAVELAVPYEAPGVIDSVAKKFNTAVLRIGRDGQRAEELYLRQLTMRDGIFRSTRLCAWLKTQGETLSELRLRMPRFSAITREIALKGGRGAAMRLMSSCCAGMSAEMAAGLRLETNRGRVYISPLREKNALKIRAESANEEIAEELCAEFEQRAGEIDQK
jgi:mannose-1-phosphate guanylyltransferase/phosphomannomutase